MLQFFVAVASIAAVTVLSLLSLYYGAEAFHAASGKAMTQRRDRFPASPCLMLGMAMLAFAVFVLGASSAVSL